MNKLLSFTASSQVKIFPDSKPNDDFTSASTLSNESFSFTVAFRTETEEYFPLSISAEAIGAEISIYKIGYVPVTRTKGLKTQLAANLPEDNKRQTGGCSVLSFTNKTALMLRKISNRCL